MGSIGERGECQVPRISPDERRVAFSRVTGAAFDVWEMDLERHVETHLTMNPSSENPGPIRISTGGGSVARWSRDGKGLFYLSTETDRHLPGGPVTPTSHLVTAPIHTSPALRVGTPVPLFEINAKRRWFDFDVSSAGRFLAVVSDTRADEQPLTVVLNRTAALDR